MLASLHEVVRERKGLARSDGHDYCLTLRLFMFRVRSVWKVVYAAPRVPIVNGVVAARYFNEASAREHKALSTSPDMAHVVHGYVIEVPTERGVIYLDAPEVTVADAKEQG
jgi:hypothetical protein